MARRKRREPVTAEELAREQFDALRQTIDAATQDLVSHFLVPLRLKQTTMDDIADVSLRRYVETLHKIYEAVPADFLSAREEEIRARERSAKRQRKTQEKAAAEAKSKADEEAAKKQDGGPKSAASPTPDIPKPSPHKDENPTSKRKEVGKEVGVVTEGQSRAPRTSVLTTRLKIDEDAL